MLDYLLVGFLVMVIIIHLDPPDDDPEAAGDALLGVIFWPIVVAVRVYYAVKARIRD